MRLRPEQPVPPELLDTLDDGTDRGGALMRIVAYLVRRNCPDATHATVRTDRDAPFATQVELVEVRADDTVVYNGDPTTQPPPAELWGRVEYYLTAALREGTPAEAGIDEPAEAPDPAYPADDPCQPVPRRRLTVELPATATPVRDVGQVTWRCDVGYDTGTDPFAKAEPQTEFATAETARRALTATLLSGGDIANDEHGFWWGLAERGTYVDDGYGELTWREDDPPIRIEVNLTDDGKLDWRRDDAAAAATP